MLRYALKTIQVSFVKANLGRIHYEAGNKQGLRHTQEAVEMLEMHPLLATPSSWSKLTKPFTDKDKSFRLHFKCSAVLTLHGMVLNKAGQWSEAKEVLKKALAIRKRLLGPGNIYTAHSRVALGMAEYQIGSRLKQLSVMRRCFMPTHPRYAYHLGTYVYLTSAQGKR